VPERGVEVRAGLAERAVDFRRLKVALYRVKVTGFLASVPVNGE
jgi:hypothetical protein